MRSFHTSGVPSLQRSTRIGSIASLAIVIAIAPLVTNSAFGTTPRFVDDKIGRPVAPAAQPRTGNSSRSGSSSKNSPAPNSPAAQDAQAVTPPANPSREIPPPSVAVPSDETEFRVSCGFIKTRAADAPPLESADERNREQLGRLVFSRINLAVEDRPLRDVLRAVRKALGINLVVFEAGPSGPGVDPDLLVSLSMEGATGREVLEALAGLTTLNVTWQIHNSTVEFGPKSVLARDAARRTHVYETTDLALDPPDYLSPLENPSKRSYNRRDSDENTGELVRMIVSHCEPEAFFPPPPRMVEDESGTMREAKHQVAPATHNPARGQSTGRTNPNTQATLNYDPDTAQIYVIGQWAAIQAKDNNLSVSAPDFVHRAIDGYGEPIPPRAAGVGNSKGGGA